MEFHKIMCHIKLWKMKQEMIERLLSSFDCYMVDLFMIPKTLTICVLSNPLTADNSVFSMIDAKNKTYH
jgi:hypothetical protein